MKLINDEINKQDYPTKIIQFGQGNFLRAFVDYFIDVANEKSEFKSSVIIVKSLKNGNLDKYISQNFLYTANLLGLSNEKIIDDSRIIKCIKEIVDFTNNDLKFLSYATLDELQYVISNTTESGIFFNELDLFEDVSNATFPAKLTKFLFHRAKHYDFDENKGLVILPTELIDDNGKKLKKYCLQYCKLFNLDYKFEKWIEKACSFCDTLVDRIVSGYPTDFRKYEEKYNYKDELLVVCEPYALWVIDANEKVKNNFKIDSVINASKLENIIFSDDIKMYKNRKVKVLNGAHASICILGTILGYDYVCDAINDKDINNYISNMIFDEVNLTLKGSEKEKKEYANRVIERLKNPYIKHKLSDISKNLLVKYNERCLPTFYELKNNNIFAKHILLALAIIIHYYYKCVQVGNDLIYFNLYGKENILYESQFVIDILNNNKFENESQLMNYLFYQTNIFSVNLFEDENVKSQFEILINCINQNGVKNAIKEVHLNEYK